MLLKHDYQVFESKNFTKKEQHLKSKNQKLKHIIGDLTVELKNRIRVTMKRKKSLAVIEHTRPIFKEIKSVKTDYSLWGYRRVWSYLLNISVNKKRIQRLMKEHNLL
jgi:hypothetical protein